MTAFDNAWSLLKARPEEQLMGMGSDYSGGMTIDPRVLSMAARREDVNEARRVERAPYTSDRTMTREQMQAAAAEAMEELERRKVEGMSPEIMGQQQSV